MHLTADQIIARLADFGLTVVTQAAWHKIANKRKAVYLSKTKKRVTAVHISGFELDHPAVVPPPKKNGAVTGHISVDHEHAEHALFMALAKVADGSFEGNKFVPGLKAKPEPKAPASSQKREAKPARRERKPNPEKEAAKAAAKLEAEMKAERRNRIAAAAQAQADSK